jgi:hypothetical protein
MFPLVFKNFMRGARHPRETKTIACHSWDAALAWLQVPKP